MNGGLTKLAGIAIAMTVVAGCASGGGASGGAAMSISPEMAAAGMQPFNANCARCHGTGGAGGRFGPNLTDDTWLWINRDSDTAFAEVQNIIRTGISTPRSPGSTGMPPIGANWSEEQVQNVAAYVLSLTS